MMTPNRAWVRLVSGRRINLLDAARDTTLRRLAIGCARLPVKTRCKCTEPPLGFGLHDTFVYAEAGDGSQSVESVVVAGATRPAHRFSRRPSRSSRPTRTCSSARDTIAMPKSSEVPAGDEASVMEGLTHEQSLLHPWRVTGDSRDATCVQRNAIGAVASGGERQFRRPWNSSNQRA